MSGEVGFVWTCDGSDATVRADARRLAARVDGNGELSTLLRSILQDVARGTDVVVLRSDDEVTPAHAARLLGVTRQYVDRLCEDGHLPYRRLPASRHRRIRVRDVIALTEERRRSGGRRREATPEATADTADTASPSVGESAATG